MTIAANRVQEFAARFNAVAASRLTEDDLVPELRVDLEVGLDEVTDELEALLRHMEPCGIGNSRPLLLARKVEVAANPRRVGGDAQHLKLWLRQDGVAVDAIAFGKAQCRLARDNNLM